MATIKELCRWKGVEIIEGEMAIDHVFKEFEEKRNKK